MTQVTSGVDALDALYQEDNAGGGAEFASFKSGTTYLVKALGTADLISFFSYGIFGKVNSFVAKNPSKKSAKGYPVDSLTPWDQAWKYHKDLSEDFNDKHGQEAGKYRAKQRFAFGFIDLDTGQPIIIDVSKNQAQAIHGALKKYEPKLGKLAFELAKTGQSTGTVVSLSPVLDFDDDLSDKQRDNFAKAPEAFDAKLFDGLLYEAEEAEQIQLLVQSGFDVSLIGLTPQSGGQGSEQTGGESDADEGVGDIEDEDLPF